MGHEMNAKKVRKKYWLSLLMSLPTLIPFAGGGSLFIICGVLGKFVHAGLALLAGLGIGIGGLFTNIALRKDKFVEKAQKEAAAEEKEERDSSLDELEKELELDDDPRTDGALRDLRALAEAFKREFEWGGTSKVAASQLLSIVNKTFVQCVKTLKATLRLYRTISSSRHMSRELQKSLKTKRNAMVARVQEGVKYLTSLFEQMQELSASDDPSSELSRLSKDLSTKLDVLKKIDQRTKTLNRQVDLGDYEEATKPDEDFFSDLNL